MRATYFLVLSIIFVFIFQIVGFEQLFYRKSRSNPPKTTINVSCCVLDLAGALWSSFSFQFPSGFRDNWKKSEKNKNNSQIYTSTQRST